MSYNILTVAPFDKQIKKLAKKYPSIKSDFEAFLDELEQFPNQGTALGENCYKVRMAIKSKGKGKSAGARIITHLIIENQTVYLLSIYDKSEHESISDNEIKQLIKLIK